MAMLPLLIIMNQSRRISFLRVNCIFIRFLTLDMIQSGPPIRIILWPNLTRPYPTRGYTRPVSCVIPLTSGVP